MPDKLLTVGDLGQQLDQPIHKIEYLLSSRKVTPIQRAGRFRLYSRDTVRFLRGEIDQMETRSKRA